MGKPNIVPRTYHIVQHKQLQTPFRVRVSNLFALVLAFLLLPFWNSTSFARTVTTDTYTVKDNYTNTNTDNNTSTNIQASVKHIWIVTNEIKVQAKQGKPEIEVYRWDPGMIVLHQGDRVMLHIYGVKGKSHPFELEGYPVKGVVIQGQVTKILFTADKVGTFPLVCLAHTDPAHNGPMIAYIEVLPNV